MCVCDGWVAGVCDGWHVRLCVLAGRALGWMAVVSWTVRAAVFDLQQAAGIIQ